MGVVDRRDSLRRFMAARQTNLSQLAKKSGVPYTTLASFMTGDTKSLKATNEALIASAYDVSVDEVFGGRETLEQRVPVVGFVGAGAEAHYYGESQSPLDYVTAPDYATPKTVAAEIRGPSVGDYFSGWLLFWDDVRSPVTPDLHGELCVVGLADGRVLVKKIMPARDGVLFHLFSMTEGPMLDQEITWAAKVTGMRPR